MADRQRFSLLAAIVIAVVSVPTPAAQPATVMTPLPLETALAAMPQGVPDAACVAKCATQRDRDLAEADKMLAGRKYYSGLGSTNCWSLDNAPHCPSIQYTCEGACKYDKNCVAACSASFQACCDANAKTSAQRYYDICVVRCPASKAAVPPPPPPPPPPSADPSKGATIDRKFEFGKMLNYANTMLQAFGPNLEGLDLERFNNLRRSLAFMQVAATLAENGGHYAMVSGGAGRIWFIRPDGKQVLLDAKTAAALRKPAYSDSEAATRTKEATAGMIAAGLSGPEANQILNNIAIYNGGARSADQFDTGGFSPGAVWYFPGDGGWAKQATTNKVLASSEHSSVRGTINGGGDFI